MASEINICWTKKKNNDLLRIYFYVNLNKFFSDYLLIFKRLDVRCNELNFCFSNFRLVLLLSFIYLIIVSIEFKCKMK